MATATAVPGPHAVPAVRIQSIDLLRGLDVWLMLFVNTLAGVQGTPAFLLHAPGGSDAMTVTDVVFPGFLFIVGLAIPFALAGRQRRGEPVWRHVLQRAGVLLVMGVFMVNADEAMGTGQVWPQAWNVLAMASLLLVSRIPSKAAPAKVPDVFRIVGIAMLVLLAFAYRREGASGLVHMRTSWWGILGLIGWAYLVAAAAYLLARGREAVIVGILALLYTVAIADGADRVGVMLVFRPFLHVSSALAGHGAVALSGVLLGVMLLRARAQRETPPHRMAIAAALYAAAMALAALLLHSLADLLPTFWYNKIRATAPWCLLSSAWTCAAWALLYFIADVHGWRRWPRLVNSAGENALLIYLVAPLLLSLFALCAPIFGTDPFAALGETLSGGIVRMLGFSFLVVGVCEALRRRGLRLQI
jgi:predicted acyltransferase